METHLADWIKDTPTGIEAESILRACVHCGFCNATCPTYQLLGDELDGPRGRIYQIKQMLEGNAPSESTQLHLDRCLTCMNCETTCPSGVRYGRLVDIGRALVEERVPRPAGQRWQRALLRAAVTTRWIFTPAVRLGRLLRPLLPSGLRNKLPLARTPGAIPRQSHARKVLLLNGCVQPALMPVIDAATARVLDALGVEAIVEPRSGCCGAIDYHLTALATAQNAARRNIDAWWPHIERGAEAIVINASGCGAMVKEYAYVLRDDPAYAEKAARVVALTRDLAEFLAPMQQALAARGSSAGATSTPRRVAFHPPCTLQHTQKIRGAVEGILGTLGAELVPVVDSHLCCGSAGSYSLLQSELSQQLRARKLENLQRAQPAMILSANIGCLTQLETGAGVPVRHWIEWVDQWIDVQQ
jgi:glycolate oxidase iron-sulfur subunit